MYMYVYIILNKMNKIKDCVTIRNIYGYMIQRARFVTPLDGTIMQFGHVLTNIR